MANGICDSYCKGCDYNQRCTGDWQTICVYYLATGKRRPCPAGEGCTVKTTKRKYSMWIDGDASAWAKKMQEAKKAKAVLRKGICPECGNEFETTNERKVYCSKHCSNRVQQRRHWERCKY